MLEAALPRAQAIGAARAAERRAQVAAQLRQDLPRAAITIEGDDVVIAGRGLADDPALRWIAGGLK